MEFDAAILPALTVLKLLQEQICNATKDRQNIIVVMRLWHKCLFVADMGGIIQA